jgi:hypothetical protein
MMKYIFGISLMVLMSYTSGIAQQKESRSLDRFNELRVNDGIEVQLMKSTEHKIEIETSGVSPDKVITDLAGGRLRIKMRTGIYPGVNVICKVYYTHLDEIQANTNSYVFSDEVITGERISLKASTAGSLNLELEMDRAIVELSAGGNAELRGKLREIFATANAASTLSGFELSCDEAELRAGGGSRIELFVNQSIIGRASTASKIYFKGDPEKTRFDATLGGIVTKAYY